MDPIVLFFGASDLTAGRYFTTEIGNLLLLDPLGRDGKWEDDILNGSCLSIRRGGQEEPWRSRMFSFCQKVGPQSQAVTVKIIPKDSIMNIMEKRQIKIEKSYYTPRPIYIKTISSDGPTSIRRNRIFSLDSSHKRRRSGRVEKKDASFLPPSNSSLRLSKSINRQYRSAL